MGGKWGRARQPVHGEQGACRAGGAWRWGRRDLWSPGQARGFPGSWRLWGGATRLGRWVGGRGRGRRAAGLSWAAEHLHHGVPGSPPRPRVPAQANSVTPYDRAGGASPKQPARNREVPLHTSLFPSLQFLPSLPILPSWLFSKSILCPPALPLKPILRWPPGSPPKGPA